MGVYVLRLGHRTFRDKRISPHCGLVARALGAEGMIYTGERDEKLEESIKKVVSIWGGFFSIKYSKSWKKVVENFSGKTVHLTMYGIPIQERIKRIRREKDLLVIVGGEKVPGEVYRVSDWNIAVTNQPHSEVAALAIFLHEYFQGKELEMEFPGCKKKIVPQEKGKKVENV